MAIVSRQIPIRLTAKPPRNAKCAKDTNGKTRVPLILLGAILERLARSLNKELMLARVVETSELIFNARGQAKRETMLTAVFSCLADVKAD